MTPRSALANEIAKNEPFVVQTTKRAVNRVWDVAGFRAAMAANAELDVMIETAEPARARRVPPHHQGARAEGGDRVAGRAVPRCRRADTSRPRNLQPLLAPRSIAIVGASESPDSWAPEIERSLRHLGYDGELYPINPKYDEVWGRPCLSSIARAADAASTSWCSWCRRGSVVRMIDDCGARGVRGIMVVSSGFAEAGEEGARAAGRSCARRPLRTGIPVLGPERRGIRQLR